MNLARTLACLVIFAATACQDAESEPSIGVEPETMQPAAPTSDAAAEQCREDVDALPTVAGVLDAAAEACATEEQAWEHAESNGHNPWLTFSAFAECVTWEATGDDAYRVAVANEVLGCLDDVNPDSIDASWPHECELDATAIAAARKSMRDRC